MEDRQVTDVVKRNNLGRQNRSEIEFRRVESKKEGKSASKNDRYEIGDDEEKKLATILKRNLFNFP